MSHVPHELSADFPGSEAVLRRLKAENAHFARLADEYHEINRAIHRAETGVEPTDDFHMQEMRKVRMVLKDEIAVFIRDA
ncbi:MAG: DUF465 domain-containing protein [Pseudomonadota bacterium]